DRPVTHMPRNTRAAQARGQRLIGAADSPYQTDSGIAECARSSLTCARRGQLALRLKNTWVATLRALDQLMQPGGKIPSRIDVGIRQRDINRGVGIDSHVNGKCALLGAQLGLCLDPVDHRLRKGSLRL